MNKLFFLDRSRSVLVDFNKQVLIGVLVKVFATNLPHGVLNEGSCLIHVQVTINMSSVFFPEVLHNLTDSWLRLVSWVFCGSLSRSLTLLLLLWVDLVQEILFHLTFHFVFGSQKVLIEFSRKSPNIFSRAPLYASLVKLFAHIPLASIICVVVDESSISMGLAVIKLTLVNLAWNHAVSTDAMILVVLVDLSEILIEAILICEFHHAKPVVNFDLTSVDPSLERNFLQGVPFVGTCLVAWLVLPR